MVRKNKGYQIIIDIVTDNKKKLLYILFRTEISIRLLATNFVSYMKYQLILYISILAERELRRYYYCLLPYVATFFLIPRNFCRAHLLEYFFMKIIVH